MKHIAVDTKKYPGHEPGSVKCTACGKVVVLGYRDITPSGGIRVIS